MDPAGARALIALNNTFYREHAASFSATRQAPWQGWGRVADELRRIEPTGPAGALAVLDLACGNMRLARFLAEALLGTPLVYHGVDDCAELAGTCCDDAREAEAGAASTQTFDSGARTRWAASPTRPHSAPADTSITGRNACADGSTATAQPDYSPVSAPREDLIPPNRKHDTLSPASVCFHRLDILSAALSRGTDALERLGLAPCDGGCCFGFMHHVPGFRLRADIVRCLLGALRPGGIAALSFWQFMDDERLAAKARAATERALVAGIVAASGEAAKGALAQAAAAPRQAVAGAPGQATTGTPVRAADASTKAALPVLEDDDYLLGWQDDPGAWRYCHHFPEEEIDALVAGLGGYAREICRFSADGRSGHLNRYLILRRV